jgi:Xaa-Pro aminopeptidase
MNSRVDKLRNKLTDGQACYISSFANIFYYSGFTSEDASLVISHDSAVLFTDSRYTVQAKNECPEFELCDDISKYSEIFKRIKAQEIFYEQQYITVAQLQKIKSYVKNIPFTPSQDIISSLRENKDEYEISKIREAERLGSEAFAYLLNELRAGMTELEAALKLEFFMRSHGARKMSFDTIAASGVRSAMPHGIASGKTIENGDFVTFDFGCVLDGYCSDMTRTIVMGHPNEKQKEIYNTVLNAQTAAIDAVCVGMRCSDVDKTARDIISKAGYGECFGHSLGHSVGIEIHENPCFSPKSEAIIQNGHVITVEPGIYVEGFGGVRIEDVVAIHNDMVENLTFSPKELIII